MSIAIGSKVEVVGYDFKDSHWFLIGETVTVIRMDDYGIVCEDSQRIQQVMSATEIKVIKEVNK